MSERMEIEESILNVLYKLLIKKTREDPNCASLSRKIRGELAL